MAFILSINLSTLPPTFGTLIQEEHLSRFGGRAKLSRTFKNSRVMNHIALKFPYEDKWSLKMGYKYRLSEASRYPRTRNDTSKIIVNVFPQAVLLGFWVGPDNEDDWGFVEALINRIF